MTFSCVRAGTGLRVCYSQLRSMVLGIKLVEPVPRNIAGNIAMLVSMCDTDYPGARSYVGCGTGTEFDRAQRGRCLLRRWLSAMAATALVVRQRAMVDTVGEKRLSESIDAGIHEALPLYVQEQGAFVGVTDELLVVRKGDSAVYKARLLDVSQLCVFGNVQVAHC